MTQALQRTTPVLTLGWRLRMALEHADIDAQDMAESLGVHRGTIRRWTHDVGAPPRPVYVEKWANLTGVPVEWLQDGRSPRPVGPDGGSDGCAIRDSNPEPAGSVDAARIFVLHGNRIMAGRPTLVPQERAA